MTKTIFFDVDTQNDFMNGNGALYVPDAESIKPTLEQLTKYACEKGIPVFGSVDRHFGTIEYKDRESELAKYGGPFPEHCMDGTEGQKKIVQTLTVTIPRTRKGNTQVDEKEIIYGVCDKYITNPLANQSATLNFTALLKPKSVLLPNDCEELSDFISKNIKKNTEFKDIPDDSKWYDGWVQFLTPGIFFEKQSYDVTTNPYFDKVMDVVKPDKAVVYGVATDYCVRAAVKGLAKHAKEIYVVTDAIKGISEQGVKETFEEWKTLGVKSVTTNDVLRGAI
jgi:nicotinamidase-related amidase